MKVVPVSGALGAEVHDVDPFTFTADGGGSAIGPARVPGHFPTGGELDARRADGARSCLWRDQRVSGREAERCDAAELSGHQRRTRKPTRSGLLAHGRHLDCRTSELRGTARRNCARTRRRHPVGFDDCGLRGAVSLDAGFSSEASTFCTTTRASSSACKRRCQRAPIETNSVASCRDNFPPVHHPLIRTHPDTGRQALFLGGRFMRRIEELKDAESDTLLQFLSHHIEDPAFHCRWRWTPGDIAIWDERSTNHRNAADYYPQEREIRRIEVGSDRPRISPRAAGEHPRCPALHRLSPQAPDRQTRRRSSARRPGRVVGARDPLRIHATGSPR